MSKYKSMKEVIESHVWFEKDIWGENERIKRCNQLVKLLKDSGYIHKSEFPEIDYNKLAIAISRREKYLETLQEQYLD